MKQLTTRDFRTFISRSFAVIALALFMMAFLSPDVFDQILIQHNDNNSPLGIMRTVEHIIFGITTN
jgi:hypothetical protein